jgi:uncharacterized surface protein with fasciclin (FAS1) repeats
LENVILLNKKITIMKLKQFFSRTSLLLFATPFIITSCEKDEDTTPAVTPTITETVVAGTSFTLLETAVIKAGYANLLGTTSNLTVFAPNDDAFRQLDITGDGIPDLDTEAKINALSGAGIDLLKAVLNYHVLTARVPSSAITTAGIQSATFAATGAGPNLFAKINGGKAYINGVEVVAADVAASNGIIHVINRVLIPPSVTITGAVVANPNFSRLLYAINRVKNNGGADIAAALNGAGPFTVFAPDNAAFSRSGFTTDASLDGVPVATLQSIILHHAVGARVFSSDLSAGSVGSLLTGTDASKTLTINLTGPAVYGAGNGATAANWPKITGVNLLQTNGVVHVIDRVILP